MSPLSLGFILLSYVSCALFVLGLAYRCYGYARAPTLQIPLTPAPKTHGGVILRLLGEALLFRSLLRAGFAGWLPAWLMHAALLSILLRHAHYFSAQPALWMYQIQTYSRPLALLLLATLAWLWLRRLAIDRLRYISTPADHLMLALLIAIALSGVAMKSRARTDMLAVQRFIRGLIEFDWQPLPVDPLLCLHLALVAALLAVFPFSKLLHAPAVWFSPTLNQRASRQRAGKQRAGSSTTGRQGGKSTPKGDAKA